MAVNKQSMLVITINRYCSKYEKEYNPEYCEALSIFMDRNSIADFDEAEKEFSAAFEDVYESRDELKSYLTEEFVPNLDAILANNINWDGVISDILKREEQRAKTGIEEPPIYYGDCYFLKLQSGHYAVFLSR